MDQLGTGCGPALPDTYYPGYEHAAMKQMVETNMDLGQLNVTGAAWNSLGDALLELQAAVRAAVGRGSEDWSGAAAAAARTYICGVGEWMGHAGRAFTLAANRMNAQSKAAAGAAAAMPEPVDFSMNDAINMLEHETNPVNLRNTIDQINRRFEEKQRAHERAAEVMTIFAATIADSGSGMPAFAPVPAMATTGGEPAGVDGDGGRADGCSGGKLTGPRGGGDTDIEPVPVNGSGSGAGAKVPGRLAAGTLAPPAVGVE